MIARIRTVLVALLTAVVAVRVSVLLPVSAVTRRIVADPDEALRTAGDPWTVAGTLGGSSIEHVRELPYAAFLWLGTEAGISASTQEATWRALVLVLAVIGAVRLARALRPPTTGSDQGLDESWAPWMGAVLFALGTVLVPTVLRSPTDGLAAATLPWVVAPLLARGSGWRPALASALWVGVAGVGDPFWALAALGAGIVALLTRNRSGVVGLVRWLVFAGAASAWWIVLLVWERVHVGDVSELVRVGVRASTAHAIARTDVPLGILLVATAWPLVVAVAALLRRSPGLLRRFVLPLLAASLVVVVLDRIGRLPVPAPAAGEDPADVAGPVLGWLGLVGLVAWCPLVADLGSRLRREAGGHSTARRPIAALVVGVLLGATAFAGIAASVADPDPASAGETELLDDVAKWSAQAGPGRVLVLPPDRGSAEMDSLGAALGRRPWVGRDAVPTSGAGGTAALDDLITRLSRADGGPGTLSALRRLGIAYVLVRLGGPSEEDRVEPTALFRAALRATGATRVAVLRGVSRGARSADGGDPLMDYGVRSGADQFEVWSPPSTGGGWVYAGSPADVVGDAGSVSDLADAGVLRDRAIALRPASDEESLVLSDSARRRDVDQRVPVDPYGPDLDASAPRSVVPTDAAPVTSASRQVQGAAAVTASSSMAELDGQHRRAGTEATAGIDANRFTAWQSRRGTGRGQWWQIRFDGLTSLSGTSVQFQRSAFNRFAVSEVRVDVDERSATYVVPADGVLDLGPLGQATRMRITVTAVAGTFGADDSVGIVEASIPGTSVTTRIALTDAPSESWLLAARLGSRVRCVPAVPRGTDDDTASGTACNAGLSVGGPDTSAVDRTVTVSERTAVVGWASLVASAATNAGALADRIAKPSVVATSDSVVVSDLSTRPQAAADADLSTAWRPAPTDRDPSLTLTWKEPAEVTGVRLLPPTGDIGSRPTRVHVRARVTGAGDGGRAQDLRADVAVDPDGTIRLPAVHTREVTITILGDTDVPSIDSAIGATSRMPVAVGEVELIGGPVVTYDATRTEEIGCDDGPVVTIAGVDHGTRLEVSAAQIVTGATVSAAVCGKPSLPAGESTVTMPATFQWQPRSLLLAAASGALPVSGAAVAAQGPVTVGSDALPLTGHGASLDLGDGDGERTLVLTVPSRTGWEASVDGRRLAPVTIDGWAQGWVVPAGTGEVRLRYSTGVDVGRLALGAASAWLVGLLLLVGFGLGRVVSATRRMRSST